jgi:hypothetical protein
LHVLTSGRLTAAERARRFLDTERRIDAAANDAGPFVYAVHASRLERLYPRA